MHQPTARRRLPPPSLIPTSTPGPEKDTLGLTAILPPSEGSAAKPRPPGSTGIRGADKIRQYVEQYDGGECFFVAPVAISEAAAALEGFGATTSTAERKLGTHFSLAGERFCFHGPAEGLGHGLVEIGDELLDLGAQRFLAGEIAATEELSRQDREPDLDLIEP
jgi:hypothetical protein